MNAHTDLKENILHRTDFVPFAIHETIALPPDKSAEDEKDTSYLSLYIHWHSEMEFFFLKEGELEFYIEQNCFILHAGDGIFVPPNLIHWTRATQKVIFYAFVVSPEWLAPYPEGISGAAYQKYIRPVCIGGEKYICRLENNRNGEDKWKTEVLKLLQNFFSLAKEKQSGKELFIRGNLLIIWQLMYENYLKYRYPDTGKKSDFPLHEVVAYIEQHYMEDISLDDLAKLAHVSRGQFCRSFGNMTGNMAFYYLNQCRIRNSCRMLTETAKKTGEIAALCGFNSISYFNRTFMKIIGMTPSQYRKKHEMSGFLYTDSL